MNQLSTKVKYDPTAWELYRQDHPGPVRKQLAGFGTLTFSVMIKILLFVYVAAKVGDLFAVDKNPMAGLVWTAAVVYFFWQLLKGIDRDGR